MPCIDIFISELHEISGKSTDGILALLGCCRLLLRPWRCPGIVHLPCDPYFLYSHFKKENVHLPEPVDERVMEFISLPPFIGYVSHDLLPERTLELWEPVYLFHLIRHLAPPGRSLSGGSRPP